MFPGLQAGIDNARRQAQLARDTYGDPTKQGRWAAFGGGPAAVQAPPRPVAQAQPEMAVSDPMANMGDKRLRVDPPAQDVGPSSPVQWAPAKFPVSAPPQEMPPGISEPPAYQNMRGQINLMPHNNPDANPTGQHGEAVPMQSEQMIFVVVVVCHFHRTHRLIDSFIEPAVRFLCYEVIYLSSLLLELPLSKKYSESVYLLEKRIK